MASIRNAGGRILDTVGTTADAVSNVVESANTGVNMLHSYVQREAYIQRINGDNTLKVRIEETSRDIEQRLIDSFKLRARMQKEEPELYEEVRQYLAAPIPTLT